MSAPTMEQTLLALEWALVWRLEGAFRSELLDWSRKSGIDMLGTDAIEADVLAELVRSAIRDPKVRKDVVVGLAEMATGTYGA